MIEEVISLDAIKHSANRFQSCPNEVIFGQVGMGKTFLMRKEVEKASKWMDYVFVFDSISEYKHPSWKQIDPHEVATKQWEPGVYVINFYGYPHEKASALACSVLKKIGSEPIRKYAIYIDETASLLDDMGWKELYRISERIRQHSFVCITLQGFFPDELGDDGLNFIGNTNFRTYFRLPHSQVKKLNEHGILPDFATEKIVSLPRGAYLNY